MRLSEENDKLFGHRYLISDAGRVILAKLEDGSIGCEGYSIAWQALTEEEKEMHTNPNEMWERFFRQQRSDSQ